METYCPMKLPERFFGMSKDDKQQRASRLLYNIPPGNFKIKSFSNEYRLPGKGEMVR